MGVGPSLQAPSLAHPFGTDKFGRDLFSRVISGARLTLFIGLLAVAIACSIGSLLGMLAGYFGGKVDNVIMRLVDVMFSFPDILIALSVVALLGPSLRNAVIAVGISAIPWYARLVRGQTLRLKQEAFVEAARASGASAPWILARHVLPNCLTPIIVQVSLDVGYAILTTAGLSFIGLGAQPPTPEWGAMVTIGKDYILDQWWFATFPGLAILLAVMSFNLLGDGLQEALSPALRRR
jgi:peptide/nickel transport system permease protein